MPVQSVQSSPSERKRTKRGPVIHRRVTDLASWMEAWNTFLLIRTHTQPSWSLELAKYQSLICHLFQAYPIPVCHRYDQLFRQAAAWDPLLRWDEFKEDLLVWCSTWRPFRANPLSACLGPPPTPNPNSHFRRATHTAAGVEICKRYNLGNCARGEECKFTHTCWHVSCRGAHPAKTCPLRSTE